MPKPSSKPCLRHLAGRSPTAARFPPPCARLDARVGAGQWIVQHHDHAIAREVLGRQIFTERFPDGVVASSARRTARLDCIVHHLGLALGARPAAGFAKRLMLPVSNDLTHSPVNASLAASRPHGNVARYAFTVTDLHRLPSAGLPTHPSTNVSRSLNSADMLRAQPVLGRRERHA